MVRRRLVRRKIESKLMINTTSCAELFFFFFSLHHHPLIVTCFQSDPKVSHPLSFSIHLSQIQLLDNSHSTNLCHPEWFTKISSSSRYQVSPVIVWRSSPVNYWSFCVCVWLFRADWCENLYKTREKNSIKNNENYEKSHDSDWCRYDDSDECDRCNCSFVIWNSGWTRHPLLYLAKWIGFCLSWPSRG